MKKILIIATALWLWLDATHAEETQQPPGVTAYQETAPLTGMNVTSLRDKYCGGELTKGDQRDKNAKFIGCMMYVLGVLDMLREWQKIDPTHALPVCVPRNATAGGLIVVVQDYIEATAPWRKEQWDATTAVIAALKSKWPCDRK